MYLRAMIFDFLDGSKMQKGTVFVKSLRTVLITYLGCPKITPSLKCLAPDADSGAKFQVLMEFDQKNEIDQGLGVPNLI